MQWHSSRDGTTTIITDDADDLIVIEPIVAVFVPAKDARCPWCSGGLAHRHAVNGQYEVVCLGCHGVFARVELGTAHG